jgi:hypothetical protein
VTQHREEVYLNRALDGARAALGEALGDALARDAALLRLNQRAADGRDALAETTKRKREEKLVEEDEAKR